MKTARLTIFIPRRFELTFLIFSLRLNNKATKKKCWDFIQPIHSHSDAHIFSQDNLSTFNSLGIFGSVTIFDLIVRSFQFPIKKIPCKSEILARTLDTDRGCIEYLMPGERRLIFLDL